ncbi:MAG: transglycosylase SLT domain-containing protein [Rhizobium sp.]|nr:transglycosylase SLT domain-containing protein [Rhizobium sp.]MBW8322002.1 transglycosylase SLT domain-containing protein [Rhizobium sp.]MBW8447922.1 transglycosylase SLT domain-containing protein [Arenimonas sp.]
MSEAMLGTVERTLETGGIGPAREIANKILTDESLSLEPSERRQYASLANERINASVAQRKADLKPVLDAATQIKDRLKLGVGLDSDDIDTTARQLAAGGDMVAALDLYQARSVAKTLQSFGLADNATQVSAAESMIAKASGSDVLLSAMEGVESEGQPGAVSPVGATGLMQVMPDTGAEIAAELGDANFPSGGSEADKQAYLKDQEVSRRYGKHYLDKMMVRYGGDREAALIAYNGGAKRADAWLAAGRDDSVIPKESADYYKKVIGRAAGAVTYTPEEANVAKTFLKSRTDKDASHIDGLDDTFAVKISRMLESAPPEIKAGLGIYSGARSVDRQQELWDAAVKRYGSEAAARKWVAPPGKSFHNHGKAADLSFNGQSLKNAPPEVVQWVHDNAGKFGLKFPLKNENWHVEDDSTRGGVASQQVAPEVIKEYQAEVTRDAKDLFGDIKDNVDKGFTPAVTDMNLLTRQLAVVDDQDLRREVADFFTAQSTTAALQGMAPADVESLMTQLKADASDGATVAQAQIISGMQAASEARNKALADDPIGYAASRGMIPAPPPLDLGQPETWGATFQSLQRGVDVLQARGEIGNVSPLRPEMLSQVNRMLSTATPQDAIGLLGSMAGNMRPETYKATLAKIYASGEGRAAATAGALAPYNPAAAEGVLRGQLLMKENPALAPKKTDDNRLLLDSMLPSAAVAPGYEASRQFLLESATARYADLSHQAGDTSGELNDTRMQQAITEVTGGLLDMNGYSVIAPKYGMSQGDFDKSLGKLTDADLAGAITSTGQRVKAEDLINQGRLRAVADGRYILEFGRPESPTYVMQQPSRGTYRQSVFVLDLGAR